MLILLLFFCSGATALIYEVVWSRYLTLLFGSTIQAQTVVLAVFMGGLALGNKLFGRKADVARRPLVIYGVIEIVIGIYALLFPLVYRTSDAIYTSMGSSLLDRSGSLLLLKGVMSLGLLLGPTILMGGTLPVLAAWLKRNTDDGGRYSARFYSVNSLGAVAGSGLAGFFLVKHLGMPATLTIAGIVNLVIGAIAIGLGRRPGSESESQDRQPGAAGQDSTEGPGASTVFRWGCVLVALTGGVSMGMEVLASRCLALLFGSSLQVFSIVLMGFILGIGLGSAVVASPRWKGRREDLVTVVVLLAVAVFLGVLVFKIESLVLLYRQARSGLARSSMGFIYYEVLTVVASMCMLGLPAAALGSVLPLWIRVVAGKSALLGDRVGRLLTWNTLGAVAGVLLTGFVLMPRIGLRGSFIALASVLAAGAICTALARRRIIAALLGAGVGAFLLSIALTSDDGWRFQLSTGIFRWHDTDASLTVRDIRPLATRILFYEDAADATVSVEAEIANANSLCLRINGKPDASTTGDLPTQIYLGQIPMLARPESKDVFVFGFGSGVTAATVLGYPIEHMAIAENCEPVLRAAKFFEPWNHVVLTNSRVRIYREDARTVLKLSPRKFDVIFSEPSNPWTVGVGSVFSREFYQFAAGRLKPGGLMAQWFHTYEMSDDVVFMVLRTFASVFPYMEIWDVGGGDIYLLGSDRPWESTPDVYRRAFELVTPQADLAAVGFIAPEVVWARMVASQRTAFAIPGPGSMQSDFNPILEYEAPRAFYMAAQSHALNFYDERTWQTDLATHDKNRTLAGLGGDLLNNLFKDPAPSWNEQLQTYVSLLDPSHNGPRDESVLVVPCVFAGTNGTVIYVPESGKTNGPVQQLCNAEVTLRNTLVPDFVRPAVENVRTNLDSLQTGDLGDPQRQADYYADLAVKGALNIGEPGLARAVLLRGLQLQPDSTQLRYLSRIMMREGVVQAADLPPLPKR